MAEFEPIYEREVVDYELPVQFGSEVVNLVINIDNTVVVRHTKAPEFDHLLVVNEDTKLMNRLWRQPENDGLFKRLPDEMGFDLWQKHYPTYDDQQAWLEWHTRDLSIDDFME